MATNIRTPEDRVDHGAARAFAGIGPGWSFEVSHVSRDPIKDALHFTGYMSDRIGGKTRVGGVVEHSGIVQLDEPSKAWAVARRDEETARRAQLARRQGAVEVPGTEATKVRLVFIGETRPHEFTHGLGPCGRTVDMLKVESTDTEVIVHQRCTDSDLFDTFAYQKAQLRQHAIYKTPQV